MLCNSTNADWACTWEKEHIYSIWKSKSRRELFNEEEKHARDLLLKYNGPFDDYARAMMEADFEKTHGANNSMLVTTKVPMLLMMMSIIIVESFLL